MTTRSRWNGLVGAALGLLAALPVTLAGATKETQPGELAVGQNADGRLEIFTVDSSGELRHRGQEPSTGDWSPWSSLGGSMLPGLAVASDEEGRLEVFAVERDTLAGKCIRQAARNSQEWGNWLNLGGRLRPPVAVGQNLDGRLQVFAVDVLSNTVMHAWQTDMQDGWSRWASIGGSLRPGLASARNQDGRLELFGVNTAQNTLVHCWQIAPNGIKGWSEWASLGGNLQPGLAIARKADGCLDVFAINRTNAAVNHVFQYLSPGGIGWSYWSSLPETAAAAIAAGQNADGRIEIFAVERKTSVIAHCWQTAAASNDWSGWSDLNNSTLAAPAVARGQDGVLHLFALNHTNLDSILHRRQILANSDWLDWSELEHSAVQYVPHTWQTDDGLPHNLVQAIAQTPDGYLWVGTRDGLARFDGVHFTSFDAKNTPAITHSSIASLRVDREGSLWIGTGDGLVKYKDGTFSRYDTTTGLVGNDVSAVYESKDGSLWIGTMTGLSRYRDKQFTSYTQKAGLLSNIIRAIHEDQDNNLWIATPSGLNCLRDGRIASFTTADALPHHSVQALGQHKAGGIWIGLEGGVTWRCRGKFYYFGLRQGLSDSFVSALCEDRSGDLWVGTQSGLNRFREGHFYDELNSEDLPYDKVNTIFEDRDGNLWIGSREGLTRLVPRCVFTYGKRQGLTGNNVMSVLENRAGTVCAGTWGGGLNQFANGRVTAYTASPTNGLANNLVLALCEGHDGSLWIGADSGGGLTRLKNGEFTHYTRANGLTNAAIRVIHEDRNGNLWVGTDQGLSCLKNGCFTNYTTRDNLAGDIVRAICEDHAGSLWFGTDHGLSRWDNGRFTNLTARDGLSDDSVLYLYEDREQNLWIATAKGGLNRYRAGRFSAYTTRQGLFSDEILAVLEDDHGWLWMSCSKGIFRVRKQDLATLDQGKTKVISSFAYGKADGMESTLCNGVAQPAAWKSRDGRLWFPTTKGLISVVTDLKLNDSPSPVFIEQLLADKRSLLPGGPVTGNPFDAPPAGSPPHPALETTVHVPPGRGELEFRFTSLGFHAPEKSRFKYLLEGVDSEWTDAGTRRVAYYNNISPGRYRFRVAACNDEGVWNETGASLAIVLAAHFWQTWWFRAVAALAVLGAVGSAVRYATQKRMQRKLRLIEQQHAVERERTRIAKDIHDDLGATLTQIGFLSALVSRSQPLPEATRAQTRQIWEKSHQMVTSMDEIVWAVNPANDSLPHLATYLCQFAESFFRATPIRCRLDVDDVLPEIALTAEVRHSLFLAVKEALNNVAKHSSASEAWLRIHREPEGLRITLEDNGRGFIPSAGAREGNGLTNMRCRLEEIGGSFDCDSRTAVGTVCRLFVPFKHIGQRQPLKSSV